MFPANFDLEIIRQLLFKPTGNQKDAIIDIARFLAKQEFVFVLRGYAGTGKTTLIGALLKARLSQNMNTVLLAPTGRAAKVMSKYAGKPAYTIHRFIYAPKKSNQNLPSFGLRQNKAQNTLFIVDESSMITNHVADRRLFSQKSLLHDLLTFVSDGSQCQVIFVGDDAQLPPVGQEESPALNIDYLTGELYETPHNTQLTQVVRQTLESQIILNATALRQFLHNKIYEGFQFKVGVDVIRLTDGYDVEDRLTQCYQNEKDESILIVRSNKRANMYNRQLRSRILWLENELASGDQLMVVKNNYFWVEKTSPMGFIANGESLELMSYKNITEMYGFKFADAEVRFVDFPNEKSIDVKLLLDTLDYDGPALNYETQKKLYNEIAKDYEGMSKREIFLNVAKNEYYNALQVKFAYAVTCHKAQGGQWKNVFVEQSWMPTGKPDREYFRWLYTAITRATDKVYLLGFSNEFFEENDF